MTALAHVEYHGHAPPRPLRRRGTVPTAGATPSSSSAPTTAAEPSAGPGSSPPCPSATPARGPGRSRLLQSEQHRPPRRLSLRLRLGRALPGAAPRRLPAAPADGRRPGATGAPGTGAAFAVRFADPYREDVGRPRAATSARRSPASPAPSRASSAAAPAPTSRSPPPPRRGRTGSSAAASTG